MDTVDPSVRSRIMSRIRSKGNFTTEVPLAKALRRMGITGWRRHVRIKTPCGHVSPDFVFRSERLVVMVHGCFWHSCPRHGSVPKSNSEFWRSKLARNRARDKRNERELRSMGWEVVRIWEHSIRDGVDLCAESVLWALCHR